MRLQTLITTAIFGATACAPTEDTFDPNNPVFDTTAMAGESALDDAGFLAARTSAESDRDGLRDAPIKDIERDIERDVRDLEDAGCRRVAYTVMRWRDEGDFKGVFFDLGGEAIARNKGHFSPLSETGGVFAGPWHTPVTDRDNARGGVMGGHYTDEHTMDGTINYGDTPFVLRGKWARLSRRGGVALGVVAYCD
jgi:hypothetical protein